MLLQQQQQENDEQIYQTTEKKTSDFANAMEWTLEILTVSLTVRTAHSREERQHAHKTQTHTHSQISQPAYRIALNIFFQ